MSINFVYAITLLNMTSTRAARVVLALYALELGAQPFTVGILAATFSAFPMLLSVPTGKLVDRFGAHWLLIIATLGGALGVLVPYFVPGFPAIFAAAAMMGFSEGIYIVSGQNLVGLLSTPDLRARNFSNYTIIGSITNFVGPLFAGFSIDQSGYVTACLYLSLLAIVPIGMLAIHRGAPRGGARLVTHSQGNIRDLLSEPGVRSLLVINSMLVSGLEMFRFYMPVYTHAIGMSATTIGMVLATYAAAEFIVRLMLPRLIARFKDRRLLSCAFYISAASIILVPFFEGAVTLALIAFIFGLGVGGGQPITMMLMFSTSAEGRSGEAMGLRMTANHFTRLVGPIVFGTIGSVFGLAPIFWIGAVMMGTGGVLSHSKSSAGNPRSMR